MQELPELLNFPSSDIKVSRFWHLAAKYAQGWFIILAVMKIALSRRCKCVFLGPNVTDCLPNLHVKSAKHKATLG